MSYSFSLQAKTVDEAKELAAEKFAEVINGQPVHEKDREAALATLDDYLGLVAAEAPEGKVYNVTMSGSVGWTGEGDERVFTGAGVNVSIYFAEAPVEAAAEPEAEAAAEEAPAPEVEVTADEKAPDPA